MRYLLAAEADKIQDFIFRSSRLREVTGASWLLTGFCQEGIEPLKKAYHAEEVVNDGGSFRLLFDSREKAVAFGADLAEFYRKTLGGTLSVAKPVALNGDFRQANEKAGKLLRQAKEHRSGAEIPPHMPFVAYCASCGVEMAVTHGHLAGEDDASNRYLCQTCQDKADARDIYRMDKAGNFIQAVQGSPEETLQFDWPDDAGDVGDYDLSGRNYVAYLVADGNGMGQIFGQCTEDQARELSQKLTEVVRNSLAVHTKTLIKHLVTPGQGRTAPVMPLILGGDDVFVLLPAPYALDFARQFCLTFEQEMKQVVDELELNAPDPTMSAAVVICKSKYPYALAHRRGEELLKEAKLLSKRLAAETGEHLSSVNFEVILGNRLVGEHDQESPTHPQTSFRPYWVPGENVALSDTVLRFGEDLAVLLQQRLDLKDIPSKRLHALRKLFSPEALPDDDEKELWAKRLETVISRSKKSHQSKLQKAFQALGANSAAGYWRMLLRGEESYSAQGFLDLLEVWHFAQNLDEPPEAYDPTDEEETA